MALRFCWESPGPDACAIFLDGYAYLIARNELIDMLNHRTRMQTRRFVECPTCVDAATFQGGLDAARAKYVVPIANLVDTFISHLDMLRRLGVRKGIISRMRDMHANKQRMLQMLPQLDTAHEETFRLQIKRIDKWLSATCVVIADAFAVYRANNQFLSAALDAIDFNLTGSEKRIAECKRLIAETGGAPPVFCVAAITPDLSPELVCDVVSKVSDQLVRVMQQELPVTSLFNSMYLQMSHVVRFGTVYSYVCEHVGASVATYVALHMMDASAR